MPRSPYNGSDNVNQQQRLKTIQSIDITLLEQCGARVTAVASAGEALEALERLKTEDCIRVLEAGFQMHIAKPIESAELVAVIKSFAECKRKG